MEPAVTALVRGIHEENRVELFPVPTGVIPRLQPISGVKAVLFDVYGTLLISGSGEVGTVLEQPLSDAFREALIAAGITSPDNDIVRRTGELFFAEIRRRHTSSLGKGIDHPEVDIIDVWQEVLRSLSISSTAERCARVAVVYEVHANPVGLMPGAATTIAGLKSIGLQIGIVSNAQFFTQTLLEYELGSTLAHAGFNMGLCAYSYRWGVAKPSPALFSPVMEHLSGAFGIQPSSVMYVGNDMLNDIYTAARIGCRTCLFAGDRRSLRLRTDHRLCAHLEPDALVTELGQIIPIVSP
ncbi:MAG: HAD family hydrolase [Spirochaetales bacterium]|nr:HAD family hydrolase [Spirochaetales bacterium]